MALHSPAISAPLQDGGVMSYGYGGKREEGRGNSNPSRLELERNPAGRHQQYHLHEHVKVNKSKLVALLNQLSTAQ
jgi:hypothetical protein